MNIAQTVTVTVFTKFINFAVAYRLRLVPRNREITAVGDNFRFLLFWKNTNKATLFNPDRKEKYAEHIVNFTVFAYNVKLSAMLCKTVALSD